MHCAVYSGASCSRTGPWSLAAPFLPLKSFPPPLLPSGGGLSLLQTPSIPYRVECKASSNDEAIASSNSSSSGPTVPIETLPDEAASHVPSRTSGSGTDDSNVDKNPLLTNEEAPPGSVFINASSRLKIRNLSRALSSVLSNCTSYDEPNSETTARVLDILSPASSIIQTSSSSSIDTNSTGHDSNHLQETSSSIEKESIGGGHNRDNSSSVASPANDGGIYAAELAAILGHHQLQTVTDSVNISGDATSKHREVDGGALNLQNWDAEWLKDENIQALVLGMVASLTNTKGALALYHIFITNDLVPGSYKHSNTNHASFLLSRLIKIVGQRHRDHAAARYLLKHAESRGIAFSTASYLAVLHACAHAGRRDLLRETISLAARSGAQIDLKTLSELMLTAHSIAGDATATLAEFEALQSLGGGGDLAAYTYVARALVSSRRINEVLDLVTRAQASTGIVGGIKQIAGKLSCAIVGQLVTTEQFEAVDALFALIIANNIRVGFQGVAAVVSGAQNRAQVLAALNFFKSCRAAGLIKELRGQRAEVSSTLQLQPSSQTSISTVNANANDDADVAPVAAVPVPGTEAKKFVNTYILKLLIQSYSDMFLALQSADLINEAHAMFYWMREDGIKPDKWIGRYLIDHFLPFNKVESAYKIYHLMKEDWGPRNILTNYCAIALIHALATKQGRSCWPLVLEILHDVHVGTSLFGLQRGVATRVQTSAITLAGRMDWLKEGLAVYKLMLRDGIMPAVITWNAIITACLRCNRPDLGIKASAAMLAMGSVKDEKTFSSLMSCCGALRDCDLLLATWAELEASTSSPDSICRNTLLWNLLQCDRPDLAIGFYNNWMTNRGSAKNGGSGSGSGDKEPTYMELCEALARKAKWSRSQEALRLGDWMREQGIDPATLTRSELARLAVGTKRTADGQDPRWQRAAVIVEGVLPQPTSSKFIPDSASRSIIILAYNASGDPEAALREAEVLANGSLPPTTDDYNAAMDACSTVGAVDAALKLLRRMKASGIKRTVMSYATGLTACYNAGKQDAVLGIWQELLNDGVVPNIVVVICLFKALTMVNGDEKYLDFAMDVYNKMKSEWNLKPDNITHITLIEGFSRFGRWAEALRMFKLMEENSPSWTPIFQPLSFVALPPVAASLHTSRVSNSASKRNLVEFENLRVLDLHGLSVSFATAAVRGWLLVIKRLALKGYRADSKAVFTIITGWGRNSPDNVAKLKPEVIRLFREGGMGRSLEIIEPPGNAGAFRIDSDKMYSWLFDSDEEGSGEAADLGFGDDASEEALFIHLTSKSTGTSGGNNNSSSSSGFSNSSSNFNSRSNVSYKDRRRKYREEN